MFTFEDLRVKLPLGLPAHSDPFQEEQTVLILVGLIASGKTTFAKALESHFPRFHRCNQDDLGSRHRVEELAYHTLAEGRSPCIDRTNFNATQRSYWTAIAREFPGTSISIIVFDTPYHICASRLERRTSHPTIRDAQHGMAVLQKFASDFSMPSPDEGYDHIIHLRPADHPRSEYTREDVLSILAHLKASTRDAGTANIPGNVRQPQRSEQSAFGRGGNQGRTDRARGYRSDGGPGGGYRGFSPSRGIAYGSSRLTSRVGNSNSSNWRRPNSDAMTDRERSDQRSAGTASVPAMESSKGRDSAEGRHNSS